uniref:Uncharacterized protein n=1 Tax=Sphaerodactylus townsendi TaxID=933632 RepID=A0ACB8EKJ0_9SAUR
MPRGEKLLSSEEDSEGSQRSQENLGRAARPQRSEPLRQNEKVCKMVDGGTAAPCNSPMHSGVPSQDCLMAQTEQEEASNPEESDSETQGKEEGELLSDQEDLEEMQVTEQSSRLFKIEDYHYLLSKSVAALHLGEAKSSEGSSKRKSTSLHKGDGEFFPPHPDSKRIFPFPEYFETQVTNQWDKPAANNRCPNYLRKLYDLPAYANNILQVPIIDGPVAALQSSGLVSKDGRGQIKDMQDRRSDQFCKRTHEATAMAIRASATASIVSRASIVWARKVLELIPPTETKAIEGVNRMLKAASFAADATLDAVTFSARLWLLFSGHTSATLVTSMADRLALKLWFLNVPSTDTSFLEKNSSSSWLDPKEKPKHLPKQARGSWTSS